ncbi:hypothetical protein Ddc_20508 [Ditylenchus destructor]|nr:hypothetical protein Ddc_20508 [Ditylenchus destructor]
MNRHPTSSPPALGDALAQAWLSDQLLDAATGRCPTKPPPMKPKPCWLSDWTGSPPPAAGLEGRRLVAGRRAGLFAAATAAHGEVRGLRNGGDFGESDADRRRSGNRAAPGGGRHARDGRRAGARPGRTPDRRDVRGRRVAGLALEGWPGHRQPAASGRCADAWRARAGPVAGRKPGHDWANQPCELIVGDQPPMGGVGGHGLNDPAWVMAGWLKKPPAPA